MCMRFFAAGGEVKRFAGVAQLVEQRTCNAKVEGSIPFTGTTLSTPDEVRPTTRSAASDMGFFSENRSVPDLLYS